MNPGALTVFCIFLGLGAAKGSVTVTFQPAASPGGGKIVGGWIEQDFQFADPNGLASNDISDNLFPYNGTAYLDFFSGDQPLTITTVDSQPFSLFTVDLAEYSTVLGSPKTVTFVGTHIDGSTTSATFTTDGIIDGNGPLQDFQTFSFPTSFSNLRQVAVATDGYAMDNLQAAIPEPASLSFILSALLFPLACGRLNRSKRQ